MTTHVIRTEVDFRQVVVSYAQEAASHGAVYIEGIFTPAERVLGGATWDEVFSGFCDGAAEAKETTGVEVRLTPDIPRGFPVEAAIETARNSVKYRDRGVVGLGLGGPESGFPPEPFAPAFRIAKDGGLGSVPHAGETEGVASIRGALDALGADRLRHGIRAVDDPALLDELASRGIVCDVCPISNLRTRAIDALEHHPLPAMLEAGVLCSISTDDPACVRYAALTKGTVLWFSSTRPVTPGISLQDEKLWFDYNPLMPAGEIPIRGRHNIENTMAAAVACRVAGAGREKIAAAVRTFKAVEHRLEFVRTVSGVDFYNDSKATNVDATLKALDAFAGGLWVILGGKDKGSDYTVLREPLKSKARAVMLIGAAAPKIREQIAGAVPLVEAQTLDVAIRKAYAAAQPNDTVLLAPACASFDQFENYEHRGRVFKEVVGKLEPKN